MEATINPALVPLYTERATRAAALFDAADPNWRDGIDVSILDMGDFTRCISAQVRGYVYDIEPNPIIEAVIRDNAEPDESCTYPTSLGLEVEDSGDPEQYATLQHVWLEVLAPAS